VLTGTTVTIIVVDDIIPDSPDSAGASPGNYSFQINCNDPSPAPQPYSFVTQQFGFRIAAQQLFFWVNCFRQEDPGNNPFINWDSRSLGTSGWAALSNNRLPRGWQLTTTLSTDQGNITGFAFTVAKPDGTVVLKSPSLALESIKNNNKVVQGNLAPHLCFQVVMVGENKGETCNFSGAEGIFLCYADNNLSANQSPPSNSNTGATVEQSDVQYASLPASYPNGEFYQPFGVGTI
jgi:hypothetical protein